MNDEGLADVAAANPFRLPDFTQEVARMWFPATRALHNWPDLGQRALFLGETNQPLRNNQRLGPHRDAFAGGASDVLIALGSERLSEPRRSEQLR
jgi:hypothetical protein